MLGPFDVQILLEEVAASLSRTIGVPLNLSRLGKALTLVAIEATDVQKTFDSLAEVLEKHRDDPYVGGKKSLSGVPKSPSGPVELSSLGRKIRIRGGKHGRSASGKAL